MITVRIDDLENDRLEFVATFNSLPERQRDRHADDEQEERKDEIGRRPAMPLRVPERPIDVRPRAGIVNEHHARRS